MPPDKCLNCKMDIPILSTWAALKAGYQTSKDWKKLERIIDKWEENNEKDFKFNGVRRGTVFHDKDSIRWIYLGVSKENSLFGFYRELDENDLPKDSSDSRFGVYPASDMKKIKYYSPLEWLVHVHKTNDPAKLLEIISKTYDLDQIENIKSPYDHLFENDRHKF